MRQGAAIDLSLSSLSELQKNNRFSNIHIIEYEDLIKNPEITMKQVYYFLEIENYIHDFNNIIDIEIDRSISDLLV